LSPEETGPLYSCARCQRTVKELIGVVQFIVAYNSHLSYKPTSFHRAAVYVCIAYTIVSIMVCSAKQADCESIGNIVGVNISLRVRASVAAYIFIAAAPEQKAACAPYTVDI